MKTGGTNCCRSFWRCGRRGKRSLFIAARKVAIPAREVAERLRKEAQLPDVFVLEGGWEAWVKKNRS